MGVLSRGSSLQRPNEARQGNQASLILGLCVSYGRTKSAIH